MCAAHTCLRRALTQAFHPGARTTPAVSAIPEFLVPALRAQSSQSRSFTSTRRCRANADSTPYPSLREWEDAILSSYPPKPSRKRYQSAVPFPELHVRRDIQPWLAAIDPFLPPRSRQASSDAPETNNPVLSSTDVSLFLNNAAEASHDILSYMGLAEGRWDAVTWLIKKIVEDGTPSSKGTVQLEPFSHAIKEDTEFRTLDELLTGTLVIHRTRPSTKLAHSLDELTAAPDAPDTINLTHKSIKSALGQVWRSIGNMILTAAEESSDEESVIMPHVLEIIAYLHHKGLIPDSVYTHQQAQDEHALQQPPTLHLLSSNILTALSDAAWRAHETSVKVATEKMNASYFLGHEIPGSRFKIQVRGIEPELWLELVLWSCLHGGWTLDGVAILERILSQSEDSRWHLICWRDLLHAEQEESSSSATRGWRIFNGGRREEKALKAEDRALTRRTISSEIVAAFIDGLIGIMRVGVGARGTKPEILLNHVKNLKKLLDLKNLSLGSSSWDSVILRLVESGGIVPEKRPQLLLSILDLASGFGSEVASTNASGREPGSNTDPSYFFEASAASLNLLHRTLRSFVKGGDISGAMATVSALQQYTDSNKQKSLHQFFETLKHLPLSQVELFTSRVPPIDFPAFDPQLPMPLLIELLDLATNAGQYEFGRWLLFSEDLDGPLIDLSMYAHTKMAASIIRFGTMAGENKLVLKVVEMTGIWSHKQQTQRLPSKLLTALFSSQVKLKRWESVRDMAESLYNDSSYRPQAEVLATFAAELLRLSNEPQGDADSQLSQARNAFRSLLFGWEDLILTYLQKELYCILGILSSVDAQWKEYCSEFLASSARQSVTLSINDFNQILGGVLDGFGSLKGQVMVDLWCYKSGQTPLRPYRAPGGLPRMQRFRFGRGRQYESLPEDIEVTQWSGAKLVLQDRIHPNQQTVWAVVRKMQQEEEQRQQAGMELAYEKRLELSWIVHWAAKLLYRMGLEYEEIFRGMGGLAQLAALEARSDQRDFHS